MPAGHLAQSPGQVGLSSVQGKVFLGEQSFKPSDLTLVPLSRRLLRLRLLGEDPNPLLQGATLSRASRASVASAEHFCRSSAEISHSFASSPSAASLAALSFSKDAQASLSRRRNTDFSWEVALSACKIRGHTGS
jgi:hypothetical protein